MSRNNSKSRPSPMTAILAVILLFAGIAAIAASMWMQEEEISLGAEEYEALVEHLKAPAATEEPLLEEPWPTAELPFATVPPLSTEVPDTPDDELPPVIVLAVPLLPTAAPQITVVPPLTMTPITQTPPTSVPTDKNTPELNGADLAACKAINSDFIGWLEIPGTDVDYPVVLTNDVAYYLDHTFTRQENIIGCLFSLGKTDYQAPSRNVAVYGHHMRRSRSTTMFQPLHEYKSSSFCRSHSTVCYDTLYGYRTYTVFAVISKRESDWDASAADFASDADFQAFLDRAKAWSLYDTGVEVDASDHILTLITCDRDYHKEDGQLVVMAVQN